MISATISEKHSHMWPAAIYGIAHPQVLWRRVNVEKQAFSQVLVDVSRISHTSQALDQLF